MLTGPKTDEINEESTDEYLKSKENLREQDDIEGIEEKTDNAQKNSDEITENIQENKKEDIGVGKIAALEDRLIESKEIKQLKNNEIGETVDKTTVDKIKESKEIKQLKNNEIGETVDKTTVDKIKEAMKVENTEEKTDNAKTEDLKNIDNISPDRTKNNIEKN
ncbi:hypothetical protein QE152_g33422 [Popillia japonica]|uniref:Uncharacterized protein n=1 Tax=Popillia japonica TaxID=7064 RepID=A0AAW1IXE3_POPJA